MRYQVARDGNILGEWTGTQLYPLLRDNILAPRDYYRTEGMNEWGRLGDLPSGKKQLATPAQREMLTRHGIAFDDLTSKAEVSCLMNEFVHTKPASEKQRAFIGRHGLICPESASVAEASAIVERIIEGQHRGTQMPSGPIDVVLKITVSTDEGATGSSEKSV
jgi:hypothetical protein